MHESDSIFPFNRLKSRSGTGPVSGHGREALFFRVFGINKNRSIYLFDLIRELIVRNIKLAYKDSALGIMWSLITPLLQLFIFYFLFQKVFSLNISRYSLFTFSGILAWTWFQASLNQAVQVVRGSRELVKQPNFPSIVLPAAAVGGNLINFLIAIIVLMGFLFLSGTVPGLSLIELPAVMAVQFFFTLSLSYLLAAMNIVFLDTQHILGVALQLYFFVTPIVYDVSSVPERYRSFYNMNPMTHLLGAYRNILMDDKFSPPIPLISILALSFCLLWGSMRFYRKMSYRFVEEL